MRNLVAIFSCEEHRDRNEAIRQTWGQVALKYADVRYFMGHAPDPLPDEVHLDGYDGDATRWTYKIERLLSWVLDHGYDGVLFADSDTYADADAIFQSDMTHYDYSGCLVGGEHKSIEIGAMYYTTPHYAFIGAGGGIWMSRKALSYVVPEIIKAATVGSAKPSRLPINHWATDVWISQVLIPKYRAGLITMKHEPNCGDGPYSWHLGHSPRDISEYSRIPEVMHEMYRKVK